MRPGGLFKPARIGNCNLSHRIALAPLTRLRVDDFGVPSDYTPLYYQQRASKGGLLISEATLPAKEAGGLPRLPGIYTNEQINRWREVVESVHRLGTFIFCQLYALGRVADPRLVDNLVGVSNDVYNGNNVKQLSEEDIRRYIAHFRQASINAVDKAGFDGVEVHSANGYLLDQAIQQVSNKRLDSYGGLNRLRFPYEVVETTTQAIGEAKTGVRISPFSRYQGMRDECPYTTFEPWVRTLVKNFPNIAYVHFVEGFTEDDIKIGDELKKQIKMSNIPVISNLAYSLEVANSRAEEHDEIVAFGKQFISNPDLPERIYNEWPLNEPDTSTYYTQGREGYIE
ncbi:FMN-linked oxidoreductase [Wallemia mellicola]|uniref:FMN-linked oxidoreductase n=1 Tax=Wallemia mellicola TaxID=1708541 RepID=A0A4T0MDH1_9BASI|nr:FMN-linked oxidoreductase [Wallemia mellicola]TIB98739.1 FMN-linked oxidoreductase [Wallemia mellicola]TIC34287.1 FMN-linked oxidoreductase [Wallemia mellicola]TIC74388.1 FMN-linked oxidoreductase [Wallemia mellicola]